MEIIGVIREQKKKKDQCLAFSIIIITLELRGLGVIRIRDDGGGWWRMATQKSY